MESRSLLNCLMARNPEKKERAASIISLLVPFVAEVIPIFLEAWQRSQSSPELEQMEEEHRRLSRRINDLEKRTRWMQYFLVALGLFFSAFLAFFVIGNYGR